MVIRVQSSMALSIIPSTVSRPRGSVARAFMVVNSSNSRRRSAMASLGILSSVTVFFAPVLPPFLTVMATGVPATSLPTSIWESESLSTGLPSISTTRSPRSSCRLLYAGPPTTMLSMTQRSNMMPTVVLVLKPAADCSPSAARNSCATSAASACSSCWPAPCRPS